MKPTNIFVDKTMLIAEVLYDAKVLGLTEPRSFGKSTNLNMLRLFFEKRIVQNREHFQEVSYRHLFKNGKTTIVNGKKETSPLAIAQDRQKWEEIYSKHQGAYPVIHMVWDGMDDCSTFAQFLSIMKEKMAKLFGQYTYLFETDKFGYKITHSPYIK